MIVKNSINNKTRRREQMKKIKYWLKTIMNVPEHDYWVSEQHHNDSIAIVFSLDNVLEIKLEVNGRNILPDSKVNDLRESIELLGDKQKLISFKNDTATVYVPELLKKEHCVLSVHCWKKGKLNFYHEKQIGEKI